MPALPPETLLHDGAYRIESSLGRGGFGLTYRARDLLGERDVAIKECFPAGCEREDFNVRPSDFAARGCLEAFRRAFHAQAQRLKALEHPSIVALLDVFDENDTTYLVMSLLEGPTLLEQVEQNGPLQSEAAIAHFEKLADALDAIHSAGFLHLDVKPENAILVNGSPVLVDFDLLVPREKPDFNTRPLSLSTQIGTPGYAPLEQYAQHAKLSPATDVYALGATLYHLLTGEAPLSAVDRAAGVALPALSQTLPQLETQLSGAIERALRLDAPARPQSVPELLELLKPPPISAQPAVDDRPQFATHAQGSYRIVMTKRQPELPARCVCCYARGPKAQWQLNSPSGKWQLPLCDDCAHHQHAAKLGDKVTFWGMGGSLILALGGVALSVANRSFLPILFCLVAIVLNFTAMSYGALKNSRAEEMLSDFCSDLATPATYVYNGRVHIWRFRNSKFAEEFKELNDEYVI